MKTAVYPLSIRNHTVARVFCCLVWAAFAFKPLQLCAASDYYRHMIFDNSVTHDTYYFSRGEANGQSFVEQNDGRLPVESRTFRTPPNAIRVQWQSAPDGGWTAQISVLDFRNRRPGLDGHNLYFWIYAPQPISAADMPQLTLSTSSEGLQVAEFPASFTVPISLSKYTGDVPGGRWIEVRIPLIEVASASIYPFRPEYLQSLAFHQGAPDNVRHTLIVDEIRVADEPLAQSVFPTPANLRATGYDRHVELEWDAGEPDNLARFVIYRSLDGGDFTPIGIQLPGFHRYEDFLGKSGIHARYKVAAADWNYRESSLSNEAAASTRPLSDEELLTMMQRSCFLYYWEGASLTPAWLVKTFPAMNESLPPAPAVLASWRSWSALTVTSSLVSKAWSGLQRSLASSNTPSAITASGRTT